MSEHVQALVVGAGVIGLAIARALANVGQEVVVLEAEREFGLHASSRNSEVIHAGLYYPQGSLKARLCVAGRRALYRYCAERGVACRRLGKLVVAVDEREHEALERVAQCAAANGVDDLQWMDGDAVHRVEPAVRCTAALWSPSTGIIDSHGLMGAYWADAQEHGAALALATPFEEAWVSADGLTVRAGGMTLSCERLINAAGMGAPSVARSMHGIDPRTIPELYLLKGNYFSLRGPAPFSRLIYPVPHTHSLGLHVTLDLGGRVRFGPDREWIDTIDYDVDPGRAAAFGAEIRRYYPDLVDTDLEPDYAGIRAKIQKPGQPPVDFVIDGPETHGIPGLINLFGIESPGLTASLAIADEVLARLGLPTTVFPSSSSS